MKTYNKKGLYNSYDKNHKERNSLDYYSTPTKEVENILNTLDIEFNGGTILEPCCGGGHMVKGILQYLKDTKQNAAITATDIKERAIEAPFLHLTGEKFDFLRDDYPVPDEGYDYIIMNPPYSTIEPFVIRALEIANKEVIMLARLQFLEGKGRYENILKDNPPSDVYVYVDRIKCFKNGDETDKSASAQAYAWFRWRKNENSKIFGTKVHWIRKSSVEK